MGSAEQAPRWSKNTHPWRGFIHSPAQQAAPPKNYLALNASPAGREFRDKGRKPPFASKRINGIHCPVHYGALIIIDGRISTHFPCECSGSGERKCSITRSTNTLSHGNSGTWDHLSVFFPFSPILLKSHRQDPS